MTKLLLDLGASPSIKDADQRTPLQAANPSPVDLTLTLALP